MQDLVVIKRYARAWLFDTSTRCFISIDELRVMTEPFKVVDMETGDDITRVLLA